MLTQGYACLHGRTRERASERERDQRKGEREREGGREGEREGGRERERERKREKERERVSAGNARWFSHERVSEEQLSKITHSNCRSISANQP